MKRSWLFAAAVPMLFFAASCSSDSTTTTEAGDSSDADSSDEAASASSDESASGGCPTEPFTGTVSSEGDDNNEAFSFTDGDVVLAEAYALFAGTQYTVYLADYEIDGSELGSGTIEADDGQVVITMQARNPDGEEIEVGTAYDEKFVIMDSGGGATGSPDDPTGTVTFIEVGDDQICFEVEFSDPGIGQEFNGTVSAGVSE